ncbi:MAG TPA: LysM peptidoglycan-binding domain-containing protein [Bacteroidales bacterium]|jgi:membrane-bound lytic murein transglycosylase D|nr:LysM peptidoglycan-binding domain-containing protein [Bacteroidales bacterium]HPB89409.1 LysM peptidoglycan-binding domain-containing protein [Bacteroidales bacterium]HQP78386.1 LysM peptidoglycan-binding domain-containing protein [Bacteroidales bacterium]
MRVRHIFRFLVVTALLVSVYTLFPAVAVPKGSLFADGAKRLSEFTTDELLSRNMPAGLAFLPAAISNVSMPGNRAGIWALDALDAVRYGLRVDLVHDQRYDDTLCTLAALSCLQEHFERYKEWDMAIAAYLHSPAVLNACLQSGDSTLLLHTLTLSDLNRMEKSGNSPSLEDLSTVWFDRPISLEAITLLTGINATDFSKANPIFRSDPLVPLDGYGLKFPPEVAKNIEVDSLYAVTERLVEARKAEVLKKQKQAEEERKQTSIIYTVKYGDTLSGIARKHRVRVSDLKKWNKLKSDFIRERQKLIIYK